MRADRSAGGNRPKPADARESRRRLPRAETVQRVTDVAIARVLSKGLSVGVDQLGFEELIAEAGVARSAVYRIWPTREDFYAHLLVELLRRDDSSIHYYSAEAIAAHLEPLLAASASRLDTLQGRRAVLVELCRVVSWLDYESTRRSAAQRTHVSLVALVQSTRGRFRAEALAVLRESESRFHDKMAEFYPRILARLGARVRPQVGLARFTTLAAAMIQGLSVQSDGLSDAQEEPFLGDPFGVGDVREWTTAAIGLTALFLSTIEFVDATLHDA